MLWFGHSHRLKDIEDNLYRLYKDIHAVRKIAECQHLEKVYEVEKDASRTAPLNEVYVIKCKQCGVVISAGRWGHVASKEWKLGRELQLMEEIKALEAM